jgi:hypothetical protein
MKIGRNAPCPCGSGKKYKKCCLPKKEVRAGPIVRASDSKRTLRGRQKLLNTIAVASALTSNLPQSDFIVGE